MWKLSFLFLSVVFFFFKQKTAYEIVSGDWSSDVCSSDLAFEPKKLPGYDLTPWEGRGAHYLVGEKKAFEGKRVMIIGGGDSACDWVVNLLDTAERVSLVHRREGFRAHEATVKEVMDAGASGRIDIHVPYQVREVTGNGEIESIRLFHSDDESQEIE